MHRLTVLGLLAVLIVGAASAGCETSPGGFPMDSPEGQYDAAQETFIAVVGGLINARHAGLLDDESWAEVVAGIEQADVALDDMKAAMEAGDGDLTRTYLAAAREALRRLNAHWIRAAAEREDN